jgi:nucleotide-binding universal stress UspA family protein
MGEKPANILVAVDGSNPSLAAVHYVARLFPPEQAWYSLFHVMDRVPEVYWDLQADAGPGLERFSGERWKAVQDGRVESFLERCFQALEQGGHRRDSITTILQERKVGIARDIAQEAQKGYDALVMGRHGLGSLKDILFGSITSKILSRVMDVPVWVVGDDPTPGKVLVAVDSSDESIRILEYVEKILSPEAGHPEIMLFHVIRGRKGFLPDYADLNALDQKEDWVKQAIYEFDKVHARMDAMFEDTLKRWENKGFDRNRISGRISQGESRAGTIMQQARRGGFDTVVVGRRGLTKVEEFFMGRVGNKVLQLAEDLAVWVVH